MADSERVTTLVATAESSSGSYNLGLYPTKDTIYKEPKATGSGWPIMGSLESMIKPSENSVNADKNDN